MALIYEPRIFKRFPNVRAALTLRGEKDHPYGFNMSLSVGDDEARVLRNRARLAERLGFDPQRLVTQRQVHGEGISIVADGYAPCDSDALITPEPAWLLAVSVADCIPILIYDSVRQVVAAVHSGWRGSQKNIVGKTIAKLCADYRSDPEHLFVYVGASAGQCCYEVGGDVVSAFDAKYSRPYREGKHLFDNKGVVLDQLLASGVISVQIELDVRCTICDGSFHSYRRDGLRSGRMFAVIGMPGER